MNPPKPPNPSPNPFCCSCAWAWAWASGLDWLPPPVKIPMNGGYPTVTVELACPAAICLATDSAVSIGIANPVASAGWRLLGQADAVAGGVHADHLPGGSSQRPAGVAGDDAGAGGDHAVQGLGGGGAALVGGGDGLAGPGDLPAGRDDGALPLGVAQRHDLVAVLDRGGVADRDGAQPSGALQADQGDVGGLVLAGDGGRVGLAGRHDGRGDLGGVSSMTWLLVSTTRPG